MTVFEWIIPPVAVALGLVAILVTRREGRRLDRMQERKRPAD